MSRNLALAALLAALPVGPVPAGDIGVADHEVTTATDIALVRALDAAVDRATDAVGTCREVGGALEICLCDSRAEIAAVRATLGDLLTVRPEWEGKALFLREAGDGRSLTIFLDTVARQAVEPDCP